MDGIAAVEGILLEVRQALLDIPRENFPEIAI
jgi:hypothetical protein